MTYKTDVAVALNDIDGTKTSSPGPTLIEVSAICKQDVKLAEIQNFILNFFINSVSSFLIYLPLRNLISKSLSFSAEIESRFKIF